jgi:hypothetical protein
MKKYSFGAIVIMLIAGIAIVGGEGTGHSTTPASSPSAMVVQPSPTPPPTPVRPMPRPGPKQPEPCPACGRIPDGQGHCECSR